MSAPALRCCSRAGYTLPPLGCILGPGLCPVSGPISFSSCQQPLDGPWPWFNTFHVRDCQWTCYSPQLCPPWSDPVGWGLLVRAWPALWPASAPGSSPFEGGSSPLQFSDLFLVLREQGWCPSHELAGAKQRGKTAPLASCPLASAAQHEVSCRMNPGQPGLPTSS